MTQRTSPMWLRWRADLRTITSEMRLTASDVGTDTSKATVVSSCLYDAANRIERGAYRLDDAILAAAAEEA